ncbi:MAG: T9SS type A sorting domain-containing protein [Taibaiella sp.]|nr:T9SS type A sorting domain-containing protein [Taibaiella sp.]
MRNYFLSALLVLISTLSAVANTGDVWQELNSKNIPAKGERKLFPDAYKLFALNDSYIKNLLFSLSEVPEHGTLLALPTPEGKLLHFRVWQTPYMERELAAKYPEIKNCTGVSVDNPNVTASINYTYKGFNAMIYDGTNTYLIDPYTMQKDDYYICYFKKDVASSARPFSCTVNDDREKELQVPNKMSLSNEPPQISFKTHGTLKKTYRLALTCTGEYALAVDGPTPSKANVISAMNTTMARVNGILQRELGVTLQLISNNDTLVYIDPATDPFTATQNSNINTNTQTANQTNTDNIIGNGNYDIGHVFCSGDGGIADKAGLCDPGFEARAATGKANPTGDAFDVDYVVHEIGHQFGAEHTFNYNGTGCNPFARSFSAYEPGSGTTIMGYAGLCPGHDIQFNSDDYFHAYSLDEMTTYMSTIPLCGSSAPSGNVVPVVADIQAVYEIPHLTPFELEAPQAVDTDHDVLNYCWEQYDLGDFGKGLDQTLYGPIFRSFKPVASRWRVFPTLDSLRAGIYSYRAEKLPQVTRQLNFRLTVRDMFNGTGTHNWSDNTVKLNVTDQSGPFRVLGPNQSSNYWRNGSSYTVSWDVANTTNAPVSCSNVDIYLSLDDGQTWPIVLATATPNDGNEVITVPAGSYTGSARVKVKGSGNVFFDISDQGFVINDWPDTVHDIENDGIIEVYPIPAKNNLFISIIDGGIYDVKMFSSIGQLVWQGYVDSNTSVNTSNLGSGIYQLLFINPVTGNKLVKRIVVE